MISGGKTLGRSRLDSDPSGGEPILERVTGHSASPVSLAALEERVRYDLECLCYPQAEWLPIVWDGEGREVRNVVIVGAGQGGLATAFALSRERVNGVKILDRAPAGGEGPWETVARMPTLRTPKYLTGPDCGIPSLTFRAWYDAQEFEPRWAELDRIPRSMWMEYLRWFRRWIGVPVENSTEVVGFAPTADGLIAVETRSLAGLSTTLVSRQLVFANGIDGGGAWIMPPALADPIPTGRRAHTADKIDFRMLAGSRVAVLGIGASALDNAAAALDAGARSVIVCFRRSVLPVLEVREWIENVGFLRGFGELDDESRWSVMHRLLGRGAPPPLWSLGRCTSDPRFRLMPATPWLSTHWTGSEIEIAIPDGVLAADFVIFATGAVTRLSLRPEFAAHAGLVQTWSDRPVAAGAPDEAMADYPYLGPGLELTEKVPDTAPWLRRIRIFNWAATASHGVSASSITGMKFGLERMIPSLVKALYVETAEQHIAAMPWPSARMGADKTNQEGSDGHGYDQR